MDNSRFLDITDIFGKASPNSMHVNNNFTQLLSPIIDLCSQHSHSLWLLRKHPESCPFSTLVICHAQYILESQVFFFIHNHVVSDYLTNYRKNLKTTKTVTWFFLQLLKVLCGKFSDFLNKLSVWLSANDNSIIYYDTP